MSCAHFRSGRGLLAAFTLFILPSALLSEPRAALAAIPTLESATGHASMNRVILTFNTAMDEASAETAGNYAISHDAASLAVTGASLNDDLRTVTLTTARQTAGRTYVVTVANVENQTGSAVASGTQASFRAFVFTPGLLKLEIYDLGDLEVEDKTIEALTTHVNYPDHPREVTYIRAFSTTYAYPDSSHDNYGSRISGLFVPPVSGNYIFYLRSDDASQLWFNPNGVSDAGKVKIAEETECCHLFSEIASAPQSLVKDTPYYIETIHREGPEDDYCEVAVKLDTDSDDPDFLTPILWPYLGIYADPTDASINSDGAKTVVALLPAGSDTPVEWSENLNGGDGGFTVESVTPQGPWTYDAEHHTWIAAGHIGCGEPESSTLTTPGMTVTNAGEILLVLRHRYSFQYREWAYDGGIIRFSVNGGAFKTVTGGRFQTNGYTGIVEGENALKGQEAFTGSTPTHQTGLFITSVAKLGSFEAGDTIALQFVAAWDECGRGLYPDWEIKQVDLTHTVAKIHIDATGSAAGVDNLPVGYNWEINWGSGFQDLGSIDDTYWFIPRLVDDQTQFKALLTIPGGTAESSVVTLRVTHAADCQIGGPYVAACATDGTGLTVDLDARGSSDPDEEDLQFAWSTACKGVTFSDPTSATPTLRIGAGFTPAASCEILLKLSDAAGASTTCSAMVNTSLSLTKPSILLKGDDATFECDSSAANQFVDPGVTATDACGNALEPVVTTTAQPDTQRADTYTVTYQAVDVFGNSSSLVTRTVTVKDTGSPTITTCAADTTLTAGKGCQATLSDLRGSLVAQDACTTSADLTITQEPAAGTVLDLGSYTVTLTVTDGAGQTATCTATVEVVSPDDNNNGQPDCLDDDSSGQAQPIVDSGCGSSACGASGAVSLMCTLLALAGLKRLPTRRMME